MQVSWNKGHRSLRKLHQRQYGACCNLRFLKSTVELQKVNKMLSCHKNSSYLCDQNGDFILHVHNWRTEEPFPSAKPCELSVKLKDKVAFIYSHALVKSFVPQNMYHYSKAAVQLLILNSHFQLATAIVVRISKNIADSSSCFLKCKVKVKESRIYHKMLLAWIIDSGSQEMLLLNRNFIISSPASLQVGTGRHSGKGPENSHSFSEETEPTYFWICIFCLVWHHAPKSIFHFINYFKFPLMK